MFAGKVTIWCPIYRSPEYAEFIRRSVEVYTPEPHEFWFMALDPETPVLDYLVGHPKQPWYLQRSTTADLGPLDYLKRVYAAINLCVAESDTDVVVVVQSDNFVSPGWLSGLLEHLDRESIVTPTLVERGRVETDSTPGNHCFPGMIWQDFGTPIGAFDEAGFLALVAGRSSAGYYENPGPYMPFAVYRDVFLNYGGFPHGNQDGVPADKIFFETLAMAGIKHKVSRSSLVYHVGEGEKRSA